MSQTQLQSQGPTALASTPTPATQAPTTPTLPPQSLTPQTNSSPTAATSPAGQTAPTAIDQQQTRPPPPQGKQRLHVPWKWLTAVLGLILGAVALIGLQPAYQSIGIGRQANTYSRTSNAYSKEGVELAKWDALLSFKQDCEARIAALQSTSSACYEVMNVTIPAPPYLYSVFNATSALHRKRSVLPASALEIAASPIKPMLMLLTLLLASLCFLRSARRTALKLLFAAVPRTERSSAPSRLDPACDTCTVGSCGAPEPEGGTSAEQHAEEATINAVPHPDFSDMSGYQRLLDLILCADKPKRFDQYDTSDTRHFSSLYAWCQRHDVDNSIDPRHRWRTPLMMCMAYNGIENPFRPHLRQCAGILLSHGAHPDRRDNAGMTALMHACQRGLLQEVEILLQAKADLYSPFEPSGFTPLHFACTGLLSTWRNNGEIPSPVDPGLPINLFREYSTIARRLVEAGANVNDVDKRGRTPLHFAMTSGPSRLLQRELISILLELGADCSMTDRNGKMPMDDNGHYLDHPYFMDATWLSVVPAKRMIQFTRGRAL